MRLNRVTLPVSDVEAWTRFYMPLGLTRIGAKHLD